MHAKLAIGLKLLLTEKLIRGTFVRKFRMQTTIMVDQFGLVSRYGELHIQKEPRGRRLVVYRRIMDPATQSMSPAQTGLRIRPQLIHSGFDTNAVIDLSMPQSISRQKLSQVHLVRGRHFLRPAPTEFWPFRDEPTSRRNQ